MSATSNAETTFNAFALVLHFYEQHRSCKLNSTDLSKIAKKYASSPANLLRDLQAKYKQSIDSSLPLSAVARLVALFDIPPQYKQLLPQSSCTYDSALDINSFNFDAAQLFSQRRIIAPDVPVKLFDNLLKTRFLVFPDQFTFSPNFVPDRSLVDKAKKIERAERELRNPLKQIVLRTLENSVRGNVVKAFSRTVDEYRSATSSSSASTKSPHSTESLLMCSFSSLNQLLLSKRRVFAVTRSKNGVSGFLTGYLRAFDAHCNMLLTDVDEQYVSIYAKDSRRSPTMPVNKSNPGSINCSFRERCYQAMSLHQDTLAFHTVPSSDGSSAKGDVSGSKRKRLIPSPAPVNGIISRHYPQLLVRGDLIVCIGEAP